MKRIFVAIPISEAPPRDFAGNLRREKKIRWIKPENLHVTLVPPWYAPITKLEAQLEQVPESVPEIVGRLKAVEGKVSSFEIRFDRVSFGPDPRQPRLIWASGEIPPELMDMKIAIEKALGKEPESRPFKLHMTLARFRAEDFPRFPVKKLDEKVDWREQVRFFTLMESRLSPQGAEYEVLEKFKLA